MLALFALSSLLVGCTGKPQPRKEPDPAPSGERAPLGREASPRITQLQLPRREPTGPRVAPEPPEPALALPLREALTVQAVGDPPRQRLRYDLTSQTRQYTVAAALSARVLTGDDQPPPPVAVPPFRETFALQVTAGSPTLFWRGEPIAVEGPAELAAAAPYVVRWKTLLAGRRAHFQLDEQRLPAQLTFPEDPLREHSAPEQGELSQRLLGWIVPLPDEPIGRGARWTAVTVLRQGLGVVKQTARYHLVEHRAGRLILEVDVRRVAEGQRVSSPDLPAGASLELLALFRAVTGQLELELAAPLPVAGRLTIEARSHQRLTRADGTASEVITEDAGALTLSSAPTP